MQRIPKKTQILSLVLADFSRSPRAQRIASGSSDAQVLKLSSTMHSAQLEADVALPAQAEPAQIELTIDTERSSTIPAAGASLRARISYFKLKPRSLGEMEPMKSVTKLLFSLLAMLVRTSLPVCFGQDVSGMAGSGTDQSGAAV